ncbi:MAG: DUF362 domain-containing protein [Candidatus Korobacteraceae bacterium]|jgi:uncharacterized protein (DUF362 family)
MTSPGLKEAGSRVLLRGVNDETLAAVVRECMEFCEWESLVARGSTVVLKPNLCTAVPEKCGMSNTDPRIAHALCELLLTRAAKVYVVESDGLRQSAWEAFEASGYRSMEALGVTLVNLSEAEQMEVEVPPAGRVKLPRLMLTADVFITLPVLKTHALTYFTGSIKNQWGCVPQYDRILLHQYLNPMLAELHAIFKPQISIMDSIIAMEGRGPANGKARRLNLLLASRDSVALDATAMRLAGLDPQLCRHLMLTAERGLGRSEQAAIEVDGDWARHATKFEPAILDKAIAAMDFMCRYRWFVKYMLEKNFVFYPVRALVQILRKTGLVEGG